MSKPRKTTRKTTRKARKEVVIDQGTSEALPEESLDGVAGGLLSIDNKANKAGPLAYRRLVETLARPDVIDLTSGPKLKP